MFEEAIYVTKWVIVIIAFVLSLAWVISSFLKWEKEDTDKNQAMFGISILSMFSCEAIGLLIFVGKI